MKQLVQNIIKKRNKGQINKMIEQKSLSNQETYLPFFLRISAQLIEKKVGNHKMRIRDDQGGIHSSLKKLSVTGEREPELRHVLRKEIKRGMICMDLGANIGYSTLLMAEKVGSTGKVYAIEPDPADIKLLNDNIKINEYTDRVEVFRMAISNRQGTMPFYLGKTSNLSGLDKTKNTEDNPIMVKVDTLTNFCMHKRIPELIKMDIEGHEVEVLEGMYGLVKARKFPCKIVMELHPMYYSKKRNLEYWMKKFLGCGFKTKYIISAGVPRPELFKKWGYKPIKTFRRKKGLYEGFSEKHMLKACCHTNKQWMPQAIPGVNKHSMKIARFVMIERE